MKSLKTKLDRDTAAISTILSDPILLESFLERVGQAGIIITDHAGVVQYASTRALRLLGLQRSVLLTQHFFKHIRLFDQQGRELGEKRTPVGSALRSSRFVQLTPFFCNYQKKNSTVSVALKVTQVQSNKQTTGAIIEIREATRKLNIDEMKSLFLSFAAHQLKTPSSVVKGFLELLIREGKKNFRPGQWDHIASAYAANEQLIRLSKTLLNLTRLEGGMIEPKVVTFNAREIAEQKIVASKMLRQSKGIEVALESPASAIFETDTVFFSELFDILFSNAVKHAPENTTVTVRLKVTDHELKLEVTDQGAGLSAYQQKELFVTAQQSNPYENSHGLGLLMAQKYLALLGGTIGVRSKIKQGATFYFTIPAPI